MKDVDPEKLKREGIPPELYDWDYHLHASGGMDPLVKAVESGDFRGIYRYHQYAPAIELTDPKPGDRILDVGFGRGEINFILAFRGIRSLGIDYSDGSVSLANELRGRLPARQRKLVRFAKMDILNERLDLEDETFDTIFFIDVIEHLTLAEGKKALKNMQRLLRTGGKIIIHTNNLWFERVAYRTVAFLYHGLRAFTAFGTRSIVKAKQAYEHLHIRYYSKAMIAKVLCEAGFEAKVWYTRPETLAQVRRLISPGKSLIRKPVPHLVWWLSKTPLIAVMSPSLWAVGRKR